MKIYKQKKDKVIQMKMEQKLAQKKIKTLEEEKKIEENKLQEEVSSVKSNSTVLVQAQRKVKENIFLKYKRNKKEKKPPNQGHHNRMLSNPIYLNNLTPQRLFDESMNLDHLQTQTDASMILETDVTRVN